MLLVTPNETSPLILRVVVSLVFLGFGLVSIRFLLGTNEQVESSSARYSKAFRKAGPRERPSSIGRWSSSRSLGNFRKRTNRIALSSK